ncbi:MAG: hypothetical protein WC178_05475 [Candidatus Paceibacterota bacterium]
MLITFSLNPMILRQCYLSISMFIYKKGSWNRWQNLSLRLAYDVAVALRGVLFMIFLFLRKENKARCGKNGTVQKSCLKIFISCESAVSDPIHNVFKFQ